MILLGTIEQYPWGRRTVEATPHNPKGLNPLNELVCDCTHCGKSFPTHATFVFKDGEDFKVLPQPCLEEAIGVERATEAHAQMLEARRETAVVQLSDLLAQDTEAIRRYILALDGNDKLTDMEKGFVLLARFPTVRIEDAHYAVELSQHWATYSAPPVTLTGEHLGTVGERISANVLVTKVVGPYSGEHGDSYLCIMETTCPLKNKVTWWTGENLSFEEGSTYYIKGTVKKLDEYDGARQTQLTRVKEVK